MQIAVLGGGNGSFAAAGDLTMAGHEVRLWRRDAQAVAAHRDAGRRVLVKDFKGRHEVVLAGVTADMAEAVRGAELILCPAPATAQADIAISVMVAEARVVPSASVISVSMSAIGIGDPPSVNVALKLVPPTVESSSSRSTTGALLLTWATWMIACAKLLAAVPSLTTTSM